MLILIFIYLLWLILHLLPHYHCSSCFSKWWSCSWTQIFSLYIQTSSTSKWHRAKRAFLPHPLGVSLWVSLWGPAQPLWIIFLILLPALCTKEGKSEISFSKLFFLEDTEEKWLNIGIHKSRFSVSCWLRSHTQVYISLVYAMAHTYISEDRK